MRNFFSFYSAPTYLPCLPVILRYDCRSDQELLHSYCSRGRIRGWWWNVFHWKHQTPEKSIEFCSTDLIDIELFSKSFWTSHFSSSPRRSVLISSRYLLYCFHIPPMWATTSAVGAWNNHIDGPQHSNAIHISFVFANPRWNGVPHMFWFLLSAHGFPYW